MPVLKIVDLQRQPLAQITSKLPNSVSLEFLGTENENDTDFRATLNAFVDYCQSNGLPLRTSRRVQEGDRTIFVDEQVLVKPDDERFLQALGDAIGCYTFGEQRKRIFALMQKEELP